MSFLYHVIDKNLSSSLTPNRVWIPTAPSLPPSHWIELFPACWAQCANPKSTHPANGDILFSFSFSFLRARLVQPSTLAGICWHPDNVTNNWVHNSLVVLWRKKVRATKNISCCKSTPMSIPRTTNVPAIRPSTSIVCIHPLLYISSQTSCMVPFASKFHVCPAWSLPFSPYHYWSIDLRTSPPPTASVCLSVCRSGLVPGPASGLRNDRALSNNLLLVTAILLWPDTGWSSWRCKKNQTRQ